MAGIKMAIDSVTIGPFKGGLNNTSQAGEAADTDLVQLVNMQVTTDGALTSRPPMHIDSGFSDRDMPFEVLGIIRKDMNTYYLIIQERNDKGGWTVRAFLNGTSTSSIIKETTSLVNKVSALVQVNNRGYFCIQPLEGATINGFTWEPGFTASDIPQMPKGYAMVSFKSRLWITSTLTSANSSRLYFSTIDATGIKLETWNTTVDYFDVAPGEGGFNTAIIALNSSLIIFKNDGAWRFSYSVSPTKGNVDKISGTIGAANRNVVAEFNNLVYTYDQGKLYELVNNNFSAINRKVEFRQDTEAVHTANGTDLSVVGSNLVLRYFNALYVFSGETGTWAQWRFKDGIPGKFIELPADSNNSRPNQYIAPTAGVTSVATGLPVKYKVIRFLGDYDSITPVEDMECIIRTKSFDYRAPSLIKRLFWWGLDHKSYLTFTAQAIPIMSRRKATWGDLRQHTWGELKAGTWGNPLKFKALDTTVSDSFDVSNEQTDNGRIFSKIKKSLRFRQIAYEIRMKTNGDKASGPVKIFSLITHVTSKHHVVDKNN